MSPADRRGHRSAGRGATGGSGKRGKSGKSGRTTAADAGPRSGASVKMTIGSTYADAREVQHLIRDEIERAGFDADSQFAIKLSLEEAIINAIKHGNKLDKDKHVQVEWNITPQTCEIIIEDEGPGFKRENVPNPTDETNLEKLTGRGILLIETYMSTVEWTKGGRKVRMVKQNQARSQGIKTA